MPLLRASGDLIQHSFELAAGRCEDLTPLVYRRLPREHPETATMFRSEGADLVKGSMLALTIEAMLDFAGERSGRFRLIECEVSSHDACGTPRELFGKFFGVIADSMREVLADDWSPEIDAAWRRLMASWLRPRRKPKRNASRASHRHPEVLAAFGEPRRMLTSVLAAHPSKRARERTSNDNGEAVTRG